MHDSLIPERATVLQEGLPEPVCPIIDVHMHAGPPAVTKGYVAPARAYGIESAVGLMHDVTPKTLKQAFGDFFIPCDWGEIPQPGIGPAWSEREASRVEAVFMDGARGMKYKDTPRRRGRTNATSFLDHPALLPVVQRLAALDMFVVAHIAEPSCWWPERFNPAEVGEKRAYFDQVEALLTAVPDLTYIGCHFGGYPEDLDYIDDMMERHPGYYVDTSATKWVVREMARHGDRAREFFIKRSDRILFGSDLVTPFGSRDETYYTSRLWCQRQMFEGQGPIPSMIHDPDATGPDFPDGPTIYGLDLPEDVLRQVYRENALRIIA